MSATPATANLPTDSSWQCPGGTPCVFCEGGLPHPDDEEEDSDFDLTTTYDGSNSSDYTPDYTTAYEGEEDEDDEEYEDEDDDAVVYIIQHVHQLFITLPSASVPEPASAPVVIVNERARVPLYYAVLLFLMEAFFSGGWHHFLLPHLLAFLLIYFD
ncbi:hypothetical protein R3P38DRAFT_2758919 [Favolaschia claudopus]|uniref:Uncharacterized protein n=1 Tax=Favolaschia claudopus TaxID=2862362 RepID=A0AAW0E2G1_9AGAR